jgi:hypothetical protein
VAGDPEDTRGGTRGDTRGDPDSLLFYHKSTCKENHLLAEAQHSIHAHEAFTHTYTRSLTSSFSSVSRAVSLEPAIEASFSFTTTVSASKAGVVWSAIRFAAVLAVHRPGFSSARALLGAQLPTDGLVFMHTSSVQFRAYLRFASARPFECTGNGRAQTGPGDHSPKAWSAIRSTCSPVC